MRRFIVSTILLFVMSLGIFAGSVEASDGIIGFDECVVERGEVILDDFYFACRRLVVRGLIDGDVVGIASEVFIAREAQVTGDLWVLSGQLIIEGSVGDDLHFGGVDLDVTGLARFPNPNTDIVAGGLSVEIAEEVVLPGNVIFYGYQAIIEGRINGNVDFQGQSLLILNDIGGNVDAIVGDQEGNAPLSSFPILYSVDFQDPGLYFTKRASTMEGYINGNLTYEGAQRVNTLDKVGGLSVHIPSISETPISQIEETDTFIQVVGNYIFVTVRDVAALSLIGILILNYFGRMIVEPGYRVQRSPISAFSWGLLLFLAFFPFALLLILTSLVLLLVVFVITINELTIITGILLLVINLGIIGGFIFLLIFLGRVISCFVIGFLLLREIQRLWKRFDDSPPPVLGELWFTIVIGVAVMSLVVNFPMGAFWATFQFILTGVIAVAGLGAMFMYIRDLYYLGGRRVAVDSGAPIVVPPPPPDDDTDTVADAPLGMSNLPAGFTGFDDWET